MPSNFNSFSRKPRRPEEVVKSSSEPNTCQGWREEEEAGRGYLFVLMTNLENNITTYYCLCLPACLSSCLSVYRLWSLYFTCSLPPCVFVFASVRVCDCLCWFLFVFVCVCFSHKFNPNKKKIFLYPHKLPNNGQISKYKGFTGAF